MWGLSFGVGLSFIPDHERLDLSLVLQAVRPFRPTILHSPSVGAFAVIAVFAVVEPSAVDISHSSQESSNDELLAFFLKHMLQS